MKKENKNKLEPDAFAFRLVVFFGLIISVAFFWNTIQMALADRLGPVIWSFVVGWLCFFAARYAVFTIYDQGLYSCIAFASEIIPAVILPVSVFLLAGGGWTLAIIVGQVLFYGIIFALFGSTSAMEVAEA